MRQFTSLERRITMYKVYITYESEHPEYVSEVETYEEAYDKAVYYANAFPEDNVVSAVIYENYGPPITEVYPSH
jgi:hypothetical protein